MNGSCNEHIFRTRTYKLYLPPSYHRCRASFPCVYVQDGGSLFEEQIECLEEKFHHGKLPELIIAGIEPKNRLNEYTPWPAASLHEAFDDFGGKGDQYLSEITEQLIPYIEENWNIDSSPQTRGFIGSSLGGLISMFALLKYPHMFGNIGSISGSFWYENAADIIKQSAIQPAKQRIYMSVGSKEGLGKQTIQKEMLSKTEQVYNSLKNKGFTPDQLLFTIEEDADHHRKFFIRQFANALEWLYEKNRSSL
ncbi:alpha/beta hydrolase [Bacillus sp. ISL-32]|nr:alpha/beta hydrolase [Bacillus sp. ISL-32]